jgi:GntR family transcriptional regulator
MLWGMGEEATRPDKNSVTGASGHGIVRDSPIPLHFQLRSVLIAMIERGEIEPGELLPSERELAAQLGISLAPVRQAILDLAKEGVLYRVRGKGTFLRDRSLLEYDAILSSFSESMRAKGLPVEMRLLSEGEVAADHEVAEALQTRERKVGQLERLAIVDGEPVALLTSRFSRRRFPALGAKLAGRPSLSRVLDSEFGVIPVRADTTIEVGRCTTAQSDLLAVSAGSSVLIASGTTYDSADEPIEYFHVVYRPDKIRLRLETYRYVESVVYDDNKLRPGRVKARRGEPGSGPPVVRHSST